MIRRLLLIGAGFALFFATAYWASVSALSPVRQETLAQPRVFAYRGWQSIGVQLNEGDFVTIRARGEWLYTPGEYHGPEGHARFPAPSFYPLSNPGGYERTHAVPGGVLIGRMEGRTSVPGGQRYDSRGRKAGRTLSACQRRRTHRQ